MTSPHWHRLARTLTTHLTLTTPLTLPEARRLLWHHLRIALAGWHEVECWHVVEAYEGVLEGMPKENQAI
jgi:hypothetical protein